nr:MAG TPA: hypothetical protein [Caudoviricetes sp.]
MSRSDSQRAERAIFGGYIPGDYSLCHFFANFALIKADFPKVPCGLPWLQQCERERWRCVLECEPRCLGFVVERRVASEQQSLI